MSKFTKATKKKAKLRMAITGPAGSGKTFSALSLAVGFAPNGKIAVIDTERGSASLYADKFEFDVLELAPPYTMESYIEAMRDAEQAGYDVVVIDSLSHAWNGSGGALEQVEAVANSSRSKNTYNAWGSITPKHRSMFDTILSLKCHVIATMRSKMTYEQREIESNGFKKKEIVKLGLAPVQREDSEYEFGIVGDISSDHILTITKSRCDAIADRTFYKPGAELAAILSQWLTDGSEVVESTAPTHPPSYYAAIVAMGSVDNVDDMKELVERFKLERAAVLGGEDKLESDPSTIELRKEASAIAKAKKLQRKDI